MKKNCLSLLLLLFLSPLLSAQQLSPSIVWQECLGGSGTDSASAVLRTADNGLLVVGGSKSNDGDVSGHHGSLDSLDGWVVKLSTSGNILWQRSIGGNGKDFFNSVTATSDGNYICMGTTTSNDGDVSGGHGKADIWLVKIDRNGNIIWQKCLGGSQDEIIGNLRENKDGSLYLIGSTYSNDGDVTGSHNPNPPYYTSDVWVAKLDKDANIVWQKCLGGISDDNGYDIVELENNQFMVACMVASDDGDFGGLSISVPRSVVAKFNAFKTMVWRYPLSRSTPLQLSFSSANSFFVSYDLNPYCYPLNITSGAMTSSYVYDSSSTTFPLTGTEFGAFGVCTPYVNGKKNVHYDARGSSGYINTNGDNITILTTNDSVNNADYHGQEDGFIARFGAGGLIYWKKMIGGTGTDYLQSATPINEFEFVVAGYTNSNNGDVSGNHGGKDFWVVKMGQVNLIKGTVFLDYNVNGTKDVNEPLIENIVVQSQKGAVKAGSSTYKGFFSNSVDTGTYITNVLTPVAYYSAVPVSRTSVFNTYNAYDSISFALQPVPGKRDYSVNLFAVSGMRPGFNAVYKIQYINNGTDTLVNKTVRMVKDSRLQFLSSFPVQNSLSGDTINWIISRLSPRDTGVITIQLKASMPPVLNILDTVRSNVLIDSSGDLTPLNNFARLSQMVSGSFDPNDKQESGGGSVTTKDISDSKYLLYTIRFQNTGNDTAFNVIIKDTLSVKVDWTSLEMIAASHPYQLNIKNGSQLTWNFNDIRLADSVHNEMASHGYITYRIKPLASLQSGDSIVNSASIYFDFNPAVKTNNQLTIVKQFVLPLPPAPVVTGLQATYCSALGVRKGKITNLPSQNSGITVNVKLDATVLTVATDSTFGFDVSAINAGAHTILVSFTNSAGADTFRYNITTTAAATPDVNVSASTTTVVNLTDPVIITATNAAGGGTSPKYTFAKDKTMSNVLQAEGSANTLTIQPNTLTVGPNWIYVRMKTSDTCYTSQTNIDSIDIERSAITGLTDVDFPNQVINIYPNPFGRVINVRGLNTGKTYTINIINATGQKVYGQQVNNSRTFTINKAGLQSGRYWLSIYDSKKHTLIGTVAVIKED